MIKPQTIISIILIILGVLFYGPYVYIMAEKQMTDAFSIIGVILLLTLLLGTCIALLGANYNKLNKKSKF